MEIKISVGVVLSIVVMESVSFLQPVWVWHSTLRVSPYVPCRNISSLCFSFPTACMSSQRWQRVLSAIDFTTSTIHPLFQQVRLLQRSICRYGVCITTATGVKFDSLLTADMVLKLWSFFYGQWGPRIARCHVWHRPYVPCLVWKATVVSQAID